MNSSQSSERPCSLNCAKNLSNSQNQDFSCFRHFDNRLCFMYASIRYTQYMGGGWKMPSSHTRDKTGKINVYISDIREIIRFLEYIRYKSEI